MENMIEIEYKTLLSFEEYRRTRDVYSSYAPILQANTYFDTPTRSLFHHGISLRIRTIKDSHTLTIKFPHGEHVEEWSESVATCTVQELNHPLIYTHIAPFLSEEINCLGTLLTSRIIIPYRKGILCLDENTYLNRVDYELEYELMEGYSEDNEGYQGILQQLEIEEKKAKGKFFRFIQLLDNDI